MKRLQSSLTNIVGTTGRACPNRMGCSLTIPTRVTEGTETSPKPKTTWVCFCLRVPFAGLVYRDIKVQTTIWRGALQKDTAINTIDRFPRLFDASPFHEPGWLKTIEGAPWPTGRFPGSFLFSSSQPLFPFKIPGVTRSKTLHLHFVFARKSAIK